MYNVHHDMVRRCTNPKRKDYKHYGGRGIKVCSRWLDNFPQGLVNFIEDMYPSFTEGLELDREDVNGDYKMSNCRWATRSIQVRNIRRNSILVDGVLTPMADLADHAGISPELFSERLREGFDVHTALNKKDKPRKYGLLVKGNYLTVKELFINPNALASICSREKVKNKDILATIYPQHDVYGYNKHTGWLRLQTEPVNLGGNVLTLTELGKHIKGVDHNEQ